MPKYLEDVFRALADPTRRLMVERLATGPATVSELAKPLPMSLPAVVQHLQVLRDSGLVRSTKTGRVRTCELDRVVFDDAASWFAVQRRHWEQRLDNLGEYLASSSHEQKEKQ